MDERRQEHVTGPCLEPERCAICSPILAARLGLRAATRRPWEAASWIFIGLLLGALAVGWAQEYRLGAVLADRGAVQVQVMQ